MSDDIPERLVELRRAFDRADARIAELAQGTLDSPDDQAAWAEAWGQAREAARVLNADPFWGNVPNPFEKRKKLRELARVKPAGEDDEGLAPESERDLGQPAT